MLKPARKPGGRTHDIARVLGVGQDRRAEKAVLRLHDHEG